MFTTHAFANNFWGKDDVGYHRLVQRMHHAKLTCEELQSFYKERMQIEAEYARKLNSLSKKALGSKETGGLRRSLEVVRSTTEQMATSHDTVSRQIHEEFLAPLESFASNMRERRKTTEDLMARLTKAKKSQNEMVEKARLKYEKECCNVNAHKAQQNLLMGRELEKNNAKLDRASFNVEQFQRDYQAALNVLSQTTENWNAMWKTSCYKFQELEQERLSYLKSNLWDFTNATSTACVNDDEGFEAIRVGLEQCDAATDIAHFVNEQGTGAQIMDPPEFTNYLSGFSRDENGGGYRLAKFGQEEEEEPDNSMVNESQHSANDSYSSNQILNMSHQSHLSIDNTPDFRPETLRGAEPHAVESNAMDDGYSSSSPYQGSMSPASSIYSSATTMSASPQNYSAKQFEPTPAEQKRRSWAKPFKRQSSPDLNKVWAALGDSTSSARSGKFESMDSTQHEQPDQHHQQQHIRFEEPPRSYEKPSRYNAATQTTGTAVRTSVASKMAQEQDPMLAAIDKLKTPPIGSGSSSRKMARPASMPGIASLNQSQARSRSQSPQRRPVHNDVRQAPPMGGAANKRPVSAHAVKTPYPDDSGDISGPTMIPARSPERDQRRHSYNPHTDATFEQKKMNRRSAEIYTHTQQQQNELYNSQQQQQPQRRPRSNTQGTMGRPRPQSSADASRDMSLLPTRTADGRGVIMHARAQFDFRARIPMEVSFRKNDILLITHKQEDGWWEAEVLTTRESGVAPGNFLREIK